MKVFFYEMPAMAKKTVKPADLQKIQDLMGGLIVVGVNPSINSFMGCDTHTLLPGDQEMNEKFLNQELIRKLCDAKQPEFKPLVLPSNEDINKAKVAKILYDYLQDQHKQGYACSIDGIHTSIEKLVGELQKDAEKSKSEELANFVLGINRTHGNLIELKYPGIFSQATPWERRISPTILEIQADKFFRDQKYPDGYVITDFEEINNLVKAFLQKNPIGVPEDTLAEIFFKVCPIK